MALPIRIDTGTPTKMGRLNYGQQFRHKCYDTIYTVIFTNPLRVKRDDGWIFNRNNNLEIVVYLAS